MGVLTANINDSKDKSVTGEKALAVMLHGQNGEGT
jgi:hypothetical protein